jgi:hypothetical protein
MTKESLLAFVGDRIKRHRQRLLALLESPSHTIKEILRDKSEHAKPGVYAIFRPDGAEVVYVGRNKTKTIADRIEQHRYGSTGADLRGMLETHRVLPQNIDDYGVRYRVVEDERDRFFFENFVIAGLEPPMNKSD